MFLCGLSITPYSMQFVYRLKHNYVPPWTPPSLASLTFPIPSNSAPDTPTPSQLSQLWRTFSNNTPNHLISLPSQSPLYPRQRFSPYPMGWPFSTERQLGKVNDGGNQRENILTAHLGPGFRSSFWHRREVFDLRESFLRKSMSDRFL